MIMKKFLSTLMDKVFVTVTRHTIAVGNKLFTLVHKSLDSFEIKFRKKVDLEPETDIIQCVAIDKNGLFHILDEQKAVEDMELIDMTPSIEAHFASEKSIGVDLPVNANVLEVAGYRETTQGIELAHRVFLQRDTGTSQWAEIINNIKDPKNADTVKEAWRNIQNLNTDKEKFDALANLSKTLRTDYLNTRWKQKTDELREFDKIKQQIKRQESIDEAVEGMVLPKVSSESE